jgi:ABC-2 type transport system permease protein
LVGLALTQYYNRALRMAAESLRRAQLSGVLEAILSTPTRPAAFVAYDAAFGIVAASTQLFFVLAIGGFTLGVDFSRTNVLGVVIAVALGLVSLTAFGILAAALTIVLKKGDPIQMVVGGAAAIVSGAFFPVSLFPKPVRVLASLLPTTHALEGARLAFFAGAGFSRIGGSLGILLAMSLVLFPLSLWCFEVAVTMARRDGTLIQY